jgi:hypothetical protein
MKLPELNIGYDLIGTPIEAICSSCGKRMEEADPLFSVAADAIRHYSLQFRGHVETHHPVPLSN